MVSKTENALINRFQGKTEVSAEEIIRFLKKFYPDAEVKTLQWRIHEFKKKGLIHHISRGLYSFRKKQCHTPVISRSLKSLYQKIHKELPYTQICVWDTLWFNEFMNHQLFRHSLVIETEKDAVESVFNRFSGSKMKVFLEPNEEIFQNYISNHDEAIIVKSMISESPLAENSGVVYPSLEKLLVDCLADTVLFAAQQNELENVFRNVRQKYQLNLNAMRRYARRRNKHPELEKWIVKTTAKDD